MTPADLGDIQSEHLGRNWEGWVGAVLICIAGGAVTLSFAPAWLVLVPVSIALLWLAMTTAWTPRKVLLRDEGLEVHRWFRRPEAWDFAGCSHILRDCTIQTTIGGTVVTEYLLTFVDDRGRRLRLNPSAIRNAEHLFFRIERLLIYPRNQRLRTSFDSGAEVAFGRISVSQAGLDLDKKKFNWANVAKVELSPVQLIFHFRRGLRRSFELRKIPFPWALLGIIKDQGVRLEFFDGFRALRD